MSDEMNLLRTLRQEYGKSALGRTERVLEIVVDHGVQPSRAAGVLQPPGASGSFHGEEIGRHDVRARRESECYSLIV